MPVEAAHKKLLCLLNRPKRNIYQLNQLSAELAKKIDSAGPNRKLEGHIRMIKLFHKQMHKSKFFSYVNSFSSKIDKTDPYTKIKQNTHTQTPNTCSKFVPSSFPFLEKYLKEEETKKLKEEETKRII